MSRAIELAKKLAKDIDGLSVVSFSDQGSEFIHAFYAKAFDDGMARAAEICSIDPSAIIELLDVVETMRDVLESIARREEYPIAKAAYSLAALEKWNASDS